MWYIVYDCAVSRVMSVASVDYHPSVVAPFKFRLLTEDGVAKFEGYVDEMNYRPLEEYGLELGCEIIEYWDTDLEEWMAF